MVFSDVISDLKVRVSIDYSQMQAGAQKVKDSVNGMANNVKSRTSRITSALGAISPKFGEMAQSAKESGEKMSKSLQGMGVSAGVAKIAVIGAFAAIAIAVVAAVKRIVTAIWNFMSNTAQMWQDAQDAEEYITAAFGSMGDSAVSWAESVSEAYGIYDTTLENTAAKLAVLYRSTGTSDAQAVKMAKSFTTLAYDLHAAFADLSIEDAQAALLQLAQGNLKGLKALGIAMNDSELQSYAVSKGIAKQGATLTTAQKQLALYTLTMERLGNASGKYAKESDDTETVLNKRNAKISELKEQIGEVFKPIVNAVNIFIGYIAEGLTFVIKAFKEFFQLIYSFFKGLLMPVVNTIKEVLVGLWNVLSSVFNSIVDAVRTLVNALSSLLGFGDIWTDTADSAESAADATEDVTDSTEEATEAAEEFAGLAAFDKLTTLSDSTSDSEDDLTTSLIDTSDAGDGALDVFDKLDNMAESIGAKIASWLNPIKWITDIDWAGYWNGMVEWGTSAWNTIKNDAVEVWNSIKNVATTVWDTITSVGSAIWSAFQSLADAFWSSVVSAGTAVWDALSGIGGAFWTSIQGWGESAWTAISDFATMVWDGISDTVHEMWDRIFDWGESTWTAITDVIHDVFTSVIDYIQDKFQAVFDVIFGWIEDIQEAIQGITDAVGNASGGVTDTLGNTWSSIKGALGFASGGVFQPNSPQLAILGDNKSEPEVAAPYSMIQSAVYDAMSAMGRSSSQPINLEISIDGQKFARATFDAYKNESKRRGVSI